MNSAQPLKIYSPLEILERAFRVYRDNFWPCVIIMTAVVIPTGIINFILSASSQQKLSVMNPLDPASISSADFNTVCFSFFILGALAIIQTVLTNGPISYIASESVFGRKVSLMEAFQARQMRFATFGWGLVQFYFALGAFAVAFIVVSSLFPPVVALLGSLVYVAVAVYGLLAPVLMLENVRPAFGITRAWSLGKSRFWTVAGLTLVLLLLTSLVTWAALTVIGLILSPQINSASPLAQDAINTVISTIASIFLLPLLPIVMTLLYYDIRLRHEGLAEALQSANNPAARPADLESPLPQPRLLPHDWRNLVIVMVITLALALIAGAYLAPLMNDLMPGLAVQ